MTPASGCGWESCGASHGASSAGSRRRGCCSERRQVRGGQHSAALALVDEADREAGLGSESQARGTALSPGDLPWLHCVDPVGVGCWDTLAQSSPWESWVPVAAVTDHHRWWPGSSAFLTGTGGERTSW